MAIERFRWWHIAEVLPLEEELFGPDKWSATMFWNELAQRHFYVVVREDDEIVGYAGLAVVDEQESWVQTIGVKREARRRGLGRELLETLLERAGKRKVLLEVAVDNHPAQKLYASYDFEPVGIRRGYYQSSNTDALVMMRDA
ncbi:ribosomal protein S18-alanine N-acetyltransferase [Couchioplanes azureus]|uniref:ribosomal protein S18-alanine N-acetyltransferase n=1 Tax=Couchioplanes caeruleus TaxID=56438 RepID=UPI0016703643|nr:ribosomal protein S18-alanine N-acetyltransferase [Couchioplanes caeruleus]GGQ66270.1 ribosomal-protein-alanine acetyltransferase [Couchioplanes caeruleus subsp. azureus]